MLKTLTGIRGALKWGSCKASLSSSVARISNRMLSSTTNAPAYIANPESPVCSWNEWDPLEEMIVGIPDEATVPCLSAEVKVSICWLSFTRVATEVLKKCYPVLLPCSPFINKWTEGTFSSTTDETLKFSMNDFSLCHAYFNIKPPIHYATAYLLLFEPQPCSPESVLPMHYAATYIHLFQPQPCSPLVTSLAQDE